MLPVLPSHPSPELDELAMEVIAGSAALGKGLNPLILEEIARLMVKVNSYYTNSMEGNPSKLKDIEDALSSRFSKEKAARNFQLEHVAHIQVQEEMIARLRAEPELSICSEAFLCWVQERFFRLLPEEMRFGKTESGKLVPVEPGQFRDRGISVGQHQAPESREEIREYLATFERLLRPERLSGLQKLLGMASSHHRFLWIHPFPEGNGRVARLLTTAYGIRIGVGDNMLWTPTRAFARNRAEYDAHLAMADQPRRNDLDGRGPLSEENLIRFCRFFLECCKDQIGYMDEMLKLSDLQRRYKLYIDSMKSRRILSASGAGVMEELLLRGEIRRRDVLRICGVKQRWATQIIRELLEKGHVRSNTAYGPLRLRISAEMAASLFPQITG